MPYRTAKLSSYEAYRESENDDPEERVCAHEERCDMLLQFPYAVMLELAFVERDFANRWCWEKFGPKDGPCTQMLSKYRRCFDESEHVHSGAWATRWFVKTDYDYGFNEWYFREQAQQEMFLAFVPQINWGERFPD